jgi:hypothetical protein
MCYVHTRKEKLLLQKICRMKSRNRRIMKMVMQDLTCKAVFIIFRLQGVNVESKLQILSIMEE